MKKIALTCPEGTEFSPSFGEILTKQGYLVEQEDDAQLKISQTCSGPLLKNFFTNSVIKKMRRDGYVIEIVGEAEEKTGSTLYKFSGDTVESIFCRE